MDIQTALFSYRDSYSPKEYPTWVRIPKKLWHFKCHPFSFSNFTFKIGFFSFPFSVYVVRLYPHVSYVSFHFLSFAFCLLTCAPVVISHGVSLFFLRSLLVRLLYCTDVFFLFPCPHVSSVFVICSPLFYHLSSTFPIVAFLMLACWISELQLCYRSSLLCFLTCLPLCVSH